MNLYTIKYDYELNPFYSEYIREVYDKTKEIADDVGFVMMVGYDEEEVRTNFAEIMKVCFLNTNKLNSYEITSIEINHQKNHF